jgi:hypothetical protein
VGYRVTRPSAHEACLVPEDNDLGVRALGELVSDLDRLPLEEWLGDPLGHRALEIGDPHGFDALASGFAIEADFTPVPQLSCND